MYAILNKATNRLLCLTYSSTCNNYEFFLEESGIDTVYWVTSSLEQAESVAMKEMSAINSTLDHPHIPEEIEVEVVNLKEFL